MENQKYSRMPSANNSVEEPDDTELDAPMEPVNLTFDQLPEARDWKDGDTYQLTVKQVSHDDDSVALEVVDAGELEAESPEEDQAEGAEE